MRQIGEHAVVFGASMGGLLAARVLAEAYERVTVIERDALPVIGDDRKGVPQGRHVHQLLPSGQNVLEELFPGLIDDLAAGGALRARALEQVRFSVGGHELFQASTGEQLVLASRPFLEGHVRDRVRALPGVRIIDRCDAVGLAVADEGNRVAGARVLRRADGSAAEILPADLVVDATGRAGRTPSWLEALGYPRPAEQRLRVSLAYASRHVRLRPGALGDDKLVSIGGRPGLPRSLSLIAQEGDRWILSVAGYAGNHPPSDPEGFQAFAATVAPPEVFAAIEDAEPLDGIVTHQFPANLRRRYDRLDRFPAGLLVFGDALASFSPVYAQGMSVAALEAVELRRCLESGEHDLAGRFFGAAAKIIELAWQLSAGGDLALLEVDGPRSPSVRLASAYTRRLQAAAEHDPVVAVAFIRVAGLLDPPSRLLSPSIALRAAWKGTNTGRGPGRGRRARPAGRTESVIERG